MAPTYYICSHSNANPCKIADNDNCVLHLKPARTCDQAHRGKILWEGRMCADNHQPIAVVEEQINRQVISMNRIEPLEFPKNLLEYQSYKKDVVKWSRCCGLDPEYQGDAILMKIPRSNAYKSHLENLIGDKCRNNKDGVKLIIESMDRLLGTDDDLEDFAKIIKLIELRRQPAESMLSFVTKFDTQRSEVSVIKDLTIPDRLYAFLFLHFASPSPANKQMAFSELKIAKQNLGDKEIPANFYTDHFFRSLRNSQAIANLGKGQTEKAFTAEAGNDDDFSFVTQDGEEGENKVKPGKTKKVNVNGNGTGYHGGAIKCWNCAWACPHGREKCKCPAYFHMEPDCKEYPAGTGTKKRKEQKKAKLKAAVKRKKEGKGAKENKEKKVKKGELTATAKENESSSDDDTDLGCPVVSEVVSEANGAVSAETAAKAKQAAFKAGQEWAREMGLNYAGAEFSGWVTEADPTPTSTPNTSMTEPSQATWGPTVDDFAIPASDPSLVEITIPDLIAELVLVAGQEPDAVLRALVDTACPTSVASEEWITQFLLGLNTDQRAQIVWKPSTRKYKFGGGELRRSLGVVALPIVITTSDGRPIPYTMQFEVCRNAAFTALIGLNFLEKAGCMLDLARREMLCSTVEGLSQRGKGIPLHKETSRHYSIELRPLNNSPLDTTRFEVPNGSFIGYHDTAVAELDSWGQDNSGEALSELDYAGFISLVTTSGAPRDSTTSSVRVTEVRASSVLVSSESEHVDNKSKLTKKDLEKIHHYFGHLSPALVKKVVIRSGRAWTEKYQKWTTDLENCASCKVNAKRKPKPKNALKNLSHFNQCMSVDLKVNTEYKDMPPFILFMMCNFSRFMRARPIKDKAADTVVRAIHQDWFELFGPPDRLHHDMGREFCVTSGEKLGASRKSL